MLSPPAPEKKPASCAGFFSGAPEIINLLDFLMNQCDDHVITILPAGKIKWQEFTGTFLVKMGEASTI
jgi:hypothetical protein